MNKGKSVERRRRKATGLSHEAHLHETIAGLPLGACFFVAKKAIQMGDREMLKGKTRQWVIGCVIAGLIASQGGGNIVLANQEVHLTETQTSYTVPSGKMRDNVTISGNNLVWIGTDANYLYQLFKRDLDTGEETQLTDTKAYKDNLAVGGDYAVFTADQLYLTLLNLRTGETEVIQDKFYAESLATDGRYVTYRDRLDTYVYVYDIVTKQTQKLMKGRYPELAEGKLILQESDGKLLLVDCAAGTTKTIKDPADGIIVNYKFNGEDLVWTQQVNEHEVQLRKMSVVELNALPSVMTQLKFDQKAAWPTMLAFNNNLIIWKQDSLVDRNTSLFATDLVSGESVLLESSETSVSKFLSIYKDQVALQGGEGNIVLKGLQVSGTPVEKETLVSAVPDMRELPRAVEYDPQVYESPTSFTQVESHPTSSDKSVSLDVPPYTFMGGSLEKISLAPANDKDLTLTKAMEKGQMMVSLPWEIRFPDTTVEEINLHMSYIENMVPANLRDKLGIYRFDNTTWEYTGGVLDGTNQIHVAIGRPGIYAIFIHDMSEEPLREYWMNKRMKAAIEQDPIRVFLDGEELHFNERPVLHESYTTVEFRTIFEKLGLNIEWNPATREVVGEKEGQSLRLQLDETVATINEQTTEMPVAPFSNKGFTFVPLRFVGEATGRKVLWDANLKAVYLYDASTEGKLLYKDGSLKYEGQLKDGKMNGKGKLYRNDGSLWYDAEFKDNEVSGWGAMYFDDNFLGEDRSGEIIVGQFKNGLPNGFVRKFDDNGYVKYEGNEVSGAPSGQAKMFIQGRPLYEGEMKGGYLDGQGKYYAGGKLYYEGGFAESLRDGYGKEYASDGRILREAIYKQGRLQAAGQFKNQIIVKGSYYYENGERYEGEFLNGLPNGQGILYDEHGQVKYQGTFKDGKPGA